MGGAKYMREIVGGGAYSDTDNNVLNIKQTCALMILFRTVHGAGLLACTSYRFQFYIYEACIVRSVVLNRCSAGYQ